MWKSISEILSLSSACIYSPFLIYFFHNGCSKCSNLSTFVFHVCPHVYLKNWMALFISKIFIKGGAKWFIVTYCHSFLLLSDSRMHNFIGVNHAHCKCIYNHHWILTAIKEFTKIAILLLFFCVQSKWGFILASTNCTEEKPSACKPFNGTQWRNDFCPNLSTKNLSLAVSVQLIQWKNNNCITYFWGVLTLWEIFKCLKMNLFECSSIAIDIGSKL